MLRNALVYEMWDKIKKNKMRTIDNENNLPYYPAYKAIAL